MAEEAILPAQVPLEPPVPPVEVEGEPASPLLEEPEGSEEDKARVRKILAAAAGTRYGKAISVLMGKGEEGMKSDLLAPTLGKKDPATGIDLPGTPDLSVSADDPMPIKPIKTSAAIEMPEMPEMPPEGGPTGNQALVADPKNPEDNNHIDATANNSLSSSMDTGNPRKGGGSEKNSAQRLTAAMFKRAYDSHVNPRTSWSGEFMDRTPWMMQLNQLKTAAKNLPDGDDLAHLKRLLDGTADAKPKAKGKKPRPGGPRSRKADRDAGVKSEPKVTAPRSRKARILEAMQGVQARYKMAPELKANREALEGRLGDLDSQLGNLTGPGRGNISPKVPEFEAPGENFVETLLREQAERANRAPGISEADALSGIRGRVQAEANRLDPLLEEALATRRNVNLTAGLGGLGLAGGGAYAGLKESEYRDKVAIFGMTSILPRVTNAIPMPKGVKSLLTDFSDFARRQDVVEEAQGMLQEAQGQHTQAMLAAEDAADLVAQMKGRQAGIVSASKMLKQVSGKDPTHETLAVLKNLEQEAHATNNVMRYTLLPGLTSAESAAKLIERTDVVNAQNALAMATESLSKSEAAREYGGRALSALGGGVMATGVGAGVYGLNDKYGSANGPFDRVVGAKVANNMDLLSGGDTSALPIAAGGLGTGAGLGYLASRMGSMGRADTLLEQAAIPELLEQVGGSTGWMDRRNATKHLGLAVGDTMGQDYQFRLPAGAEDVDSVLRRMQSNVAKKVVRKRLLPFIGLGAAAGLGGSALYSRGLENKRMVPSLEMYPQGY